MTSLISAPGFDRPVSQQCSDHLDTPISAAISTLEGPNKSPSSVGPVSIHRKMRLWIPFVNT